MKVCFVFVYAKDNMIKALGFEDARLAHGQLIRNGWSLRVTIDACVFIEHLHNQCDDVAKAVNELSGRDNRIAKPLL